MNPNVAYDRDQMVFTVDILTHYTTRQFYIQPEREGDWGDKYSLLTFKSTL